MGISTDALTWDERVTLRARFGRFLQNLRDELRRQGCDFDRLPRWLTAAEVRVGVTGDWVVAVFDESTRGEDHIDIRQRVMTDTAILLGEPDFVPDGAALRPGGNTTVERDQAGDGAGDRAVAPVINLVEGSAFSSWYGRIDYERPNALIEFFLRRVGDRGVTASRFIPLALQVHIRDALDRETAAIPSWLDHVFRVIVENLRETSAGAAGDYFQSLVEAKISIPEMGRRGVLVLGKYDPPRLKDELQQVRDELVRSGHLAYLLIELPDRAGESWPRKAMKWMMNTRFSVMVDRTQHGGGQISEFELVKNTQTILAKLQSSTGASTGMIDDPVDLVDLPYVSVFEFEGGPLEVLENAVEWAEGYEQRRVRSRG